jgi:hypothetical protein
VEKVKAFLFRVKSARSEGDVAAGTGLDIGSVKKALYDLMRRYRATLSVREDGSLIYDFGESLVPLSEISWREKLSSFGAWVWKGFSFAYKSSLAVVLVLYALIFVLLILAAAISASAASEDEGPAEGAFRLVAAVFEAIFDFVTYQAIVYDDTDSYGYPYKHYEPKVPVLPQREQKEHAKSFIASVYDFVLGPKRIEADGRAQHRELASFVRKNRGVLTVRDVQALSGMSRAEAEAFFAKFVAEQGGQAEVSEEGALYATFEELLRSKSKESDEPIVYYWDEYEAPHELTGNTAGKNVAISLLAAFNLAGSYFVVNTLPELSQMSNWFVWLGIVPGVIFSLFFALPLLRAPLVWWRNRKQHVHNIRKRLFRAIFGASDSGLAAADVVERANQAAETEEKLRIADMGPLVEETLGEVGGERSVDGKGRIVTDMRRLRLEEEAAVEYALAEEEAEVVYRSDQEVL